MEHPHIAHRILAMKDADLQLREQLIQSGQLGQGYHPDMEALHLENADMLDSIIDSIGYPTAHKVGEEASQAAWLLIQHAIGRPAFMRKCQKLLQEAAHHQGADPRHLAYLSDRIAVLEDRPQQYGTQFDWDEQGMLSPNAFDNLALVNQRRKAIGLNTLETQTDIIRQRAIQERQQAPTDLAERKREMEVWRKRAGWLL